jgi:FdhD protein
VETAEKTGLTVVGFARSNKMVVYTHTHRIEGAGTAASASAPE